MEISVDTGKSWTKVAWVGKGGNRLLRFPTSVRETNGHVLDGMVVRMDGGRYAVGESGENYQEHTATTDKASQAHRLAVLAGICRAMRESGAKAPAVTVRVNVPLLDFLDAGKREAICRQYHGRMRLNMDGENYEFDLQCKPYFEGLGTWLKNKKDWSDNETTVVVNIGSLNVNVLACGVNKMPELRKCSTLVGGVYGFLAIAQREIMAKAGEHRGIDSVESYLYGRRPKGIDETMGQLIEGVALAYVKEIREKMARLGINPKDCRFIFSGGGAKAFEAAISQEFQGAAIDPDGAFADVIGALSVN